MTDTPGGKAPPAPEPQPEPDQELVVHACAFCGGECRPNVWPWPEPFCSATCRALFRLWEGPRT